MRGGAGGGKGGYSCRRYLAQEPRDHEILLNIKPSFDFRPRDSDAEKFRVYEKAFIVQA